MRLFFFFFFLYLVGTVATHHLNMVSNVAISLLTDTAAVYRNEVAIGNSIKRILEQNLVPDLTRADIFLTSKLGKDLFFLKKRRSFLTVSMQVHADTQV